MYSLRAAALDLEPDKAEWLIDLLAKLGREDDAYDAVALILPEIADAPRQAKATAAGPAARAVPAGEPDVGDGFADAGLLALPVDGGEPEELPADELDRIIGARPVVTLREEGVPAELSPGRFLKVMTERILDGSPVNFHLEARRLRRTASAREPLR